MISIIPITFHTRCEKLYTNMSQSSLIKRLYSSFHYQELKTLPHFHACITMGSLTANSQVLPSLHSGVPNQETTFKPHSPFAVPPVPSSQLCTSHHHPSRVPFIAHIPLLQGVTMLSTFIQSGFSCSCCTGQRQSLLQTVGTLSRRAVHNQGSPPPDLAPICQITLTLWLQPNSPAWREVQVHWLFP